MFTDHINGQREDNTRRSLRTVTARENSLNRRSNTSKSVNMKGVSWHRGKAKWISRIRVHGKLIHLGYFTTKNDAAMAYNAAAVNHFGQYARLNT
jgi:hypothetical protein